MSDLLFKIAVGIVVYVIIVRLVLCWVQAGRDRRADD